MNAQKFSDAMSLIDDRYITEALKDRRDRPLHLRWWKFHKAAACFSAAVFAAMLLFGTAFAGNPDFRQAVISVLFPTYTDDQLHEIEDGHRTGSFSMEDTLFTFLTQFNEEHLAGSITAKKDHGFEYTVVSSGENFADVVVECTTPDHKLLVIMERTDYEETTGLWQITAYQTLNDSAAEELLDNRQ